MHNIQPKTKRRETKRLGRSGNRGKTSGRGTKGQKARSGHKIRPEIRDLIKKIPKRRGYGKNRAQSLGFVVPRYTVSLSKIQAGFSDGAVVSPETLYRQGLTPRSRSMPQIKILNVGDISKKLIFVRCLVSQSARQKIEKAGGMVK